MRRIQVSLVSIAILTTGASRADTPPIAAPSPSLPSQSSLPTPPSGGPTPSLTPPVTAAPTNSASGSCNGAKLLQNNTPLSDLCPNGFGQFHPQSVEQAMQDQPNNVAMVEAAAAQYGVPTDLALAVSYHESEGFNSCAGSDTGVKGPMQLTQQTGRDYGFDRDINEQNIQGGMAKLSDSLKACGNNASNYTCLASHYNGSPRPGEQAGWASHVAADDAHIKHMVPSKLDANGCFACGNGGNPAGTPTNAPAPASSDVTMAA